MGESEISGLRSDERGNLLAVGAVALSVLLVVASATVVTTSGPEGGTAPDADAATELVEDGIESELDRTNGRTAGKNGSVPNDARASRSAAAQRAVDRAFGEGMDETTRTDVARLLSSVVEQQQRTGEVTWIEPADAGVSYGVKVELGEPNAPAGSPRSATRKHGEAEVRPEPLAPTDDPHLLLEEATATRDSSVTVVTRTLSTEAANATSLVAVPSGEDPTGSDVEWRLAAYRASNGTAVVEMNDERVTSDSAAVRINLDEMTVNGTAVGASKPSEATPTPFDLYLRDAGAVEGAYSLFGSGADASGMGTVDNVTVERAIDTAAFDVTYQDERTTFTDTVVVEPDRGRSGPVVVAPPERNASDRPPEAAFTITEQRRNGSHVTYRLDATPTSADTLLTTYEWTATDHASQVTDLADGQATQTITVDRTGSAYYLPIELRVVDETGRADTTQRGTTVPDQSWSSLDPTADMQVTALNDTHATVEVAATKYTDPARYDFAWTVRQSGGLVDARVREDSGRTATYTVRRPTREQRFAVELAVNDTALNLDGSTTTGALIPARNLRPTARLNVRDRGTEQGTDEYDKEVYWLDASGSSDPDGRIDDYRFTLDGRPIDAVGTASVTQRSPNGSVVGLEIQRKNRSQEFVAGLAVTDDDGATDTTNDYISVSTGEGDGLDVTLTEVERQNATVEYRVTGNVPRGSYTWSASGDGTVSNLTSGRNLYTQRFTADRSETDWELTVTGSVQRYGRTSNGSATVTVPGTGDDGNNTRPGPITEPEPSIDASLTAEPTESNNGAKVIELNATDTVSNVNIDNWEYDVDVTGGTLEKEPSDGSPVTTVEIVPTEDGTISADFEVTATDTDSDTSDTASDSLNRVKITLPNTPPEAAVDTTVEAVSGTMGTFEIDATNSTDYDGEIVAYEYEVISAKSEETLKGQLTDNQTTQTVDTRIVGEGADATIRLTVRDDDNATNSTVFELSNRPEGLDVNLEAEVFSSSEDAVGVTLTGSVDGPVSPDDYTKRYSATIDNGSLRNSLDDDAAVQQVAIDRSGGEVQATFELIVTDRWDRTYTDTATITDDIGRPPVAELTATTLNKRPQTAKWELSAASTDDPDDDLKSLTYDLNESRSHGDIQGSLTDGVENQTVTVELTRDAPDAVIELTATDDAGLTDTATVELDGTPSQGPSPNITDAAANPNPTSIGEETTLWVQTETPQTVEVEHGSSRGSLGTIETTRVPMPSFVSANTFPKPNGFITHEFDDGGTQRITFVAQNGSDVDTKQIDVEVNGEPEVTNVRQTDVYVQQELDDWPTRQFVAEVEVETDQPAWGEYDVSIEGDYAGSQVPVCRGPVNGHGECTQPSEMTFTGPQSTTFLVPINSGAWTERAGATKETVTITVSDDRGNVDRTTVTLKEDMSDHALWTSITGTDIDDDMRIQKPEGETLTLDYTVNKNWVDDDVPVSYPAYDLYSGVKILDNNGNLVAESYENGSISATRTVLATVKHDLPADMPPMSEYTIKSFVGWNKQGPGDFRLISRNTETLTVDEDVVTPSMSSMASANLVSAVEGALSTSQQLQREAEQARSNSQTQPGSSDPRRSDSNTEPVTVGEDRTRVNAPTVESTNPVSAFEGTLSTLERLQG